MLVLLVAFTGGAEIVLSTSTLRQIGRQVGQWVTVTADGHELRAHRGPCRLPELRLGWSLFGYDLGIPPGAITPARALMVMAPAVIVIANVVAFWPGRATARLSPADVLRAE